MEVAALDQAFRQRVDDNAEPYLFSTDDAYRWASEGEREACLRAKLIFEQAKPSLCVLPVMPGVTTYALNPLIIEVAAVHLDRSAQYPTMHKHRLHRVDQSNTYRHRRCRDYGNQFVGYGDITGDFGLGMHVRMFSIDGNTLQLYGTPDDSYAAMPALSYLRLEVYRLPLDAMEQPNDEPEIPLIHQDGLVDWMVYRALTSTDADESADTRGQTALAMFTQRFGPRPSASQVRMQAEGRRWTTRYGGIG